MTRVGGLVGFLHNCLPGETVEGTIQQTKRSHFFASTDSVLIPSRHRVAPQEAHFLACSPWQIMTREFELESKRAICQEVFQQHAGLKRSDLTLTSSAVRFGYRNKLEFQVIQDGEGMRLGIYQRSSHQVEKVEGCVLGQHGLNQAAQQVLVYWREWGLPPHVLKKIVVRCNTQGELHAQVHLKHPVKLNARTRIEPLVGLHLRLLESQARRKKNGSWQLSIGRPYLTETLQGTTFRFGPNSFFQINPPLFEEVLQVCRPFVQGEWMLDLFSGVGAIGGALSTHCHQGMLVESNPDAAHFAKINCQLNRWDHLRPLLKKSEQALEIIKPEQVVIMDPPRRGLPVELTHHLLLVKPKRLIYLSCDPVTCARDVKILSEAYQLTHCQLFDFFPATPHVEVLVILDRND